MCQLALDNNAVSCNLFEMWISGLCDCDHGTHWACVTRTQQVSVQCKGLATCVDLVRSKDKTVETKFNTAIKALKGKENSLQFMSNTWIGHLESRRRKWIVDFRVLYDTAPRSTLCRKYISGHPCKTIHHTWRMQWSCVDSTVRSSNDCSLFLSVQISTDYVCWWFTSRLYFPYHTWRCPNMDCIRILIEEGWWWNGSWCVQWRATESLNGAQKNRFLMC